MIFDGDFSIESGALDDVKQAAAYTIYNDIYMSLMNRFTFVDKEAEDFLSSCILEYMLSKNATLDGSEYRQTLYNIMSIEYIIVTDGSEYSLWHRDEWEDDGKCEEYNLSDSDLDDIVRTIRRYVKEEK